MKARPRIVCPYSYHNTGVENDVISFSFLSRRRAPAHYFGRIYASIWKKIQLVGL